MQELYPTIYQVHLMVTYGDFGHFYHFWSVGFKISSSLIMPRPKAGNQFNSNLILFLMS